MSPNICLRVAKWPPKLRSVTPLSFCQDYCHCLALPPGSCLGQSGDPHVSSSSKHWYSNVFRILVLQQLCKTEGFVKVSDETQRGTLGLFPVIVRISAPASSHLPQRHSPLFRSLWPLATVASIWAAAEGRQERFRLRLTAAAWVIPGHLLYQHIRVKRSNNYDYQVRNAEGFSHAKNK